MPRLLISLFTIALFLALTALGVWYLAESKPEARREPPRELGPVPVVLRTLEPRSVRVEVQGFGTLAAVQQAELAMEWSGRVVRRFEPWHLGVHVQAGTSLVDLDPALLDQEVLGAEARLAEAQAALAAARVEEASSKTATPLARESHDLAQREEARLRELSAAEYASQSQIDAAARARSASDSALESAFARERAAVALRAQSEAAVESARAALDLAGERRKLTELRAPFDGQLATEGPSVGDFLAMGQPFAKLVDLSRLRVVLQVQEEEFAGLAVGQMARVLLRASDLEFAGRVIGLGVEADPVLRALPVEVELDNLVQNFARSDSALRDGSSTGREDAASLRAGQFVEVRVAKAEVESALVLSRDEMVWRDNVPTGFVYVEDSGGAHVEARRLQLGARVELGILVLSGLSAGERLIVAPLGRLQGGEDCRERESAGGN